MNISLDSTHKKVISASVKFAFLQEVGPQADNNFSIICSKLTVFIIYLLLCPFCSSLEENLAFLLIFWFIFRIFAQIMATYSQNPL